MKKYTDQWLDYNDISEGYIQDRLNALEKAIENASKEGNKYLITIIGNDILFEALLPILLKYTFRVNQVEFGYHLEIKL